MTTTDTCRCGHGWDEHDPIDEQFAGACSACDCAEFYTPPRPPERITTHVTLVAQQLPDDHPAWADDRGSLVARRWWNVTVVDSNGVEHHGVTSWQRGDVHEIIRDVTRPERPSEAVMRMLASEQRERES